MLLCFYRTTTKKKKKTGHKDLHIYKLSGWLHYFVFLPEMSESSCSIYLSTFVVSVLDFGHSNGCVVLPHVHLHFHDYI